MQNSKDRRQWISTAARMTLAMALFAGAVTTGVVLAFDLPLQHADGSGSTGTPKKIASSVPGENENAAFFYDAIGRAPTSVSAASQASERTGLEHANYTLELQVASDRDEAERTIDTLHDRGIEAYYTPLTRKGQVVFRVRQGIFASRPEAEKAAIALRQSSSLPAAVVKLQ